MGYCKICKKEKLLSENLGICLECIRQKPEEAISLADYVHKKVREGFNLPAFPPKTENGFKCELCFNRCSIGKKEKGYCGLRENFNGFLKSKVSQDKGVLDFYYDPIPTNCCAEWFCGADIEGKGKAFLNVGEPVGAAEFFQAGLEIIPAEQDTQAEQAEPHAEEVDRIEAAQDELVHGWLPRRMPCCRRSASSAAPKPSHWPGSGCCSASAKRRMACRPLRVSLANRSSRRPVTGVTSLKRTRSSASR